ncbi:unnamed protein product, partial [Porites evermanni]
YQEVISKPIHFDEAFKPFNVGATRFPAINKDHGGHPGPGAYEFDAKRDRKVKFHGSFGGPQTLITSVVIKCNEFGEPDICKSCRNPPVGDYYEYKKVHLCRKCYDHHLKTGEKYTKSYLQSFYKVRDCSNIHNHEGTNARLMLKTERDLKKQRFREAYMSLYF